MLNIVDFQERSLNGPVKKADVFDLSIAKSIRKLVKKYELKFTPDQLLVDDATADAVYQAALEFLVEVGVLNNDTERVITWTQEEAEEVGHWYQHNPSARTFGRGKDEHTVMPRTGKDTRPPVNWACTAGVIGEEWFIPFLQAAAQAEAYQGFGIAGGIGAVNGIVPKAGNPSEIVVGMWEARAQMEALRRAGRPDMHLGLIPTVSTTGATAAILAQGLRQPYNSMIGIHIIPEQKLDWERLNLTALCHETGVSPWTSAMSILGGLGGSPAGVAIILTANFIAQLSLGRGKLGSMYVNDMVGRNSHREAIWTYSAGLRAVERNIGVASGTCAGDSSAVFSRSENVIRGALVAIVLTASGGAYNWGAGNNPVVGRIHRELMKNVAGMDSEKVNSIMISISEQLEEMDSAGGTPVGFADLIFPVLFDVTTLKPTPGYLADCKHAVELMAKAGAPFSSSFSLD